MIDEAPAIRGHLSATSRAIGPLISEQLIENWIDYKLNKEFNEVRSRPHPYEISLYYDV